jgi:hypothetical protein
MKHTSIRSARYALVFAAASNSHQTVGQEFSVHYSKVLSRLLQWNLTSQLDPRGRLPI